MEKPATISGLVSIVRNQLNLGWLQKSQTQQNQAIKLLVECGTQLATFNRHTISVQRLFHSIKKPSHCKSKPQSMVRLAIDFQSKAVQCLVL